MGFREAIYQNVDIFGTMSHAYLMASIQGIFPLKRQNRHQNKHPVPNDCRDEKVEQSRLN